MSAEEEHLHWCTTAGILPADVLYHGIVPTTLFLKMPHANDVKRMFLLNSSDAIDRQFSCVDCSTNLSEQESVLALRILIEKTLRATYTSGAGFCAACAEKRGLAQSTSGTCAQYAFVLHLLKEAIDDIPDDGERTLAAYLGHFVECVQRRQASFLGAGCWTCGKTTELPLMGCGACKRARYCSRGCQRYDWVHGHHRKVCASLVHYSFLAPQAKWKQIYAI